MVRLFHSQIPKSHISVDYVARIVYAYSVTQVHHVAEYSPKLAKVLQTKTTTKAISHPMPVTKAISHPTTNSFYHADLSD